MAKAEATVTFVNAKFEPLTMYLSVVKSGQRSMSNGTLYIKKVQTIHVPSIQDEVYLWWDSEENEEGPLWYVKKRWMGHDGSWSIELAKMVINPCEQDQNYMKNSIRSGKINEWAWYTNTDGPDPEDLLVRLGGWKKYGND